MRMFKTYSEYSDTWSKLAGIKIRTFDNTIHKINKDSFYLNRICSSGCRIVDPAIIRNCIEITPDYNKWNKEYFKYFLISKLPAINRNRFGSCQLCVRIDTIKICLSNIIDNKNHWNDSVLYTQFEELAILN